MTNKELAVLIEDSWGEDEEQAKAYARIIMTHTKPEFWAQIIEKDLFFNRYNESQSYDELAEEIFQDEILREDDDAGLEDYFGELEAAYSNKTTKEVLEKDGWRIDEVYGGAIGFDKYVLLENNSESLITFEELVSQLKDEPTESALADVLNCRYVMSYYSHYGCKDFNESGYCFIYLKEGIYQVPFECVSGIGEGYEYLHLDRAIKVNKQDAINSINDDIERASAFLSLIKAWEA